MSTPRPCHCTYLCLREIQAKQPTLHAFVNIEYRDERAGGLGVWCVWEEGGGGQGGVRKETRWRRVDTILWLDSSASTIDQ